MPPSGFIPAHSVISVIDMFMLYFTPKIEGNLSLDLCQNAGYLRITHKHINTRLAFKPRHTIKISVLSLL